MPVRDLTVHLWNETVLNVYEREEAGSTLFYVTPQTLEKHGLTMDEWWAHVQRMDDAYVAVSELIDWNAVLAVALEHRQEGGGLSTISASRAVEARQAELFAPAVSVFPRDAGTPFFGPLDWSRVMNQAEGHYLQRRPKDTEPGLDAEAIREAFLSVDSRSMYGTALVAPRRRDMCALFSPDAEDRRAFNARGTVGQA